MKSPKQRQLPVKKEPLRVLETFKPAPDALTKLRERLRELTTEVATLERSALVSATYDGDRRVAVLKFYEPNKHRIYLWSDKSGHKPYCFSKLPSLELQYLLKERPNLDRIETVKKYEPLSDKEIEVSKIIAKDPLAIGGQDTSLRNAMNCWEADIKYYENYLYDKGLVVGAHYNIKDGKIEPVPFDMPKEVQDSLKKTLESAKPELAAEIRTWALLLNQPLLDIKHAAIDIEVWSQENRIPDPKFAEHPVVAISIVARNSKTIYLLKRENLDLGSPDDVPSDATILLFEKERICSSKYFGTFWNIHFSRRLTETTLIWIICITELCVQKWEFPKTAFRSYWETIMPDYGMGCTLIFTKLSTTDRCRSTPLGTSTSGHTLDEVAEGLLGATKIPFEGSINDLPSLRASRIQSSRCRSDIQARFDL